MKSVFCSLVSCSDTPEGFPLIRPGCPYKLIVAESINAVFGTIGDALAKGDAVQLIGFGTFGVKERAAREGRNPRTGETVKIAASKVPTS